MSKSAERLFNCLVGLILTASVPAAIGHAQSTAIPPPEELRHPPAGESDGVQPAQHVENILDEEQRAVVERVNAYLNGLSTLQGEFTQISDTGGLAEGTFYLKMPGKLRFDYAPPVEMGFISDGTWVAVDDKALDVVNRYPLSSTPLKFLVSEDIDLMAAARITDVAHGPNELRITAEETDGPAPGRLTMIFAEPALELRQWIVEDVQGTRTTVLLRNVKKGADIDSRLFVIEDAEKDKWD